MDKISKETRSSVMRQVKSEDTGLELKVRRLLHRMGFRFRLHRQDLPGKPDIVLPRRRAVILIHGCFWHQHEGCPRSVRPTSNVPFWTKKLDRNIQRDRENLQRLQEAGWRVFVVWECQASEIRLREEFDRFFAALP